MTSTPFIFTLYPIYILIFIMGVLCGWLLFQYSLGIYLLFAWWAEARRNKKDEAEHAQTKAHL